MSTMSEKAKKKNFRKKADDDQADDSVGAGSTQAPSKVTAKPVAAPRPTSLLSFEAEEGEDEVQIHKPKSTTSHTHSKKVSRTKEDRPASNQIGTSGDYTKEKLAELKKNATHFSTSSDTPPSTKGSESAARPFSTEKSDDQDIPDAEIIRQAKLKRERMRAINAGQYIPLQHETQKNALGDFVDKKTVQRVDMSAILHAEDVDRDRARKAMDSLAEDEQSDEEDELYRWEMEQIRKGVRKPVSVQPLSSSGQGPGLGGGSSRSPTPSAAVAALNIDGRAGYPVSRRSRNNSEEVYNKMAGALERMRENQKRKETQLGKVSEDFLSSAQTVTKLEDDIKSASSQYTFFQDMKLYLEDLLDCLSEKAPRIESLEDKVHGLRTERAAAYFKRREQDTNDFLDDVRDFAGEKPAKPRPASSPKEDLDEFGRDRNYYVQASRARRKEQREKKRKKQEARRRELGRKQGPDDEQYGWATEEESDAETETYVEEIDKVKQEAKDIFGDVTEEFSDIRQIRARMERWKAQYPKAYSEAYVSLVLPTLFAPYVRLQMLAWDPMAKPAFDNVPWYTDLFDYGINVSQNPEEDPDLNLVPELVKKIIVPRVKRTFTSVWDPTSRRQNRIALSIIDNLLLYCDVQVPAVKEMLEAVISRMATAVETAVVPAFGFNNDDSSMVKSEEFQFCESLFWNAVKLMKNICMWHEVFAVGPLETTVVDNLLDKKLLPYMNLRRNQVSVITMAEKIVDILPEKWVQRAASKSSPTLKSFRQLLSHIISLLQNQFPPTSRNPSTEAASAASRLLRLLNTFGMTEDARMLSKMYRL